MPSPHHGTQHRQQPRVGRSCSALKRGADNQPSVLTTSIRKGRNRCKLQRCRLGTGSLPERVEHGRTPPPSRQLRPPGIQSRGMKGSVPPCLSGHWGSPRTASGASAGAVSRFRSRMKRLMSAESTTQEPASVTRPKRSPRCSRRTTTSRERPSLAAASEAGIQRLLVKKNHHSKSASALNVRCRPSHGGLLVLHLVLQGMQDRVKLYKQVHTYATGTPITKFRTEFPRQGRTSGGGSA